MILEYLKSLFRGKASSSETPVEIPPVRKTDTSRYPVMQLTRQQYDEIPRAEDMSEGFLETCEFGTRFRCRGSTSVEDTVIGILVKGDDALCDQYGAGLAVPERFVNRYRVSIVKGL